MAESLPITEFLQMPEVMLDVRSPGEYNRGHIPGASSFPLFSDEERAKVGICYKHEGRDAAVELGFALTGPKFAGFIGQARQLAPEKRVRLHCWRGGMRSEAVAWVLEMAGFQVSLLRGGYKAFRRWVLATVEQPRPILILGGMTGTGKTEVLHALAKFGEQTLDLEALANHRGSSYGGIGMPPQPTQEQFENRIAMVWANLDPQRPVWIEAESKRVGISRIPEPIYQQMERSPVLELVRPHQERLDFLVAHYGGLDLADLMTATRRIRKRLGGLRTQQAVELLQERKFAAAFDLVLAYYDKTYRYDLERRKVPRLAVDVAGCSSQEAAAKLLAMSADLDGSLDPGIQD
jgi:tRNA 2-selenouridine synthase